MALNRIAQIEANADQTPASREESRRQYQHKADGLQSIIAANNDAVRDSFRDDRQLRLDVLDAQRRALSKLRKRGALHVEAVRRISQDLDLEEQRPQNHNQQSS